MEIPRINLCKDRFSQREVIAETVKINDSH